MSINLAEFEFCKSNLLMHLPRFDEIYYNGIIADQINHYRAIREQEQCSLYSVSLIRKEEDVLISGVKDLFVTCLKTAAMSMRGNFIFEVLSFDVQKEINSFDLNQLATLLINKSFKMSVGEKVIVKYSTVYAFFQKISDSPWGKIKLKTSIECFKDDPKFADIFLKQILKRIEFSNDPCVILIHDLSTNPILDLNNEVQSERISILMEKQKDNFIEFMPEIYWQDKKILKEFLTGDVISVFEKMKKG